ncbi:DEAD/DEAH box helicase [Listeria seeligeri]|uniref:DEAD/DEAH box helicase n=1 Tax=Listeria seeligeri TaxID=1640 RepID=UPI00162A9529|nr:DEAD/DEAH box helicase [Listeria seeligeri]MBC1990344.1 DEAD/DEAH box helicase [Listeria seeligeri]
MTLLTEMMDHQQIGYDKLKNLTVGALHMDTGTGKTRTMLQLIQKRLDENKISKVLWITLVSVKKNLAEDIQKHSDFTVGMYEEDSNAFIQILGTQTLSSSNKAYVYLCDLVEEYGHKLQLVIDESHEFKNPGSIRAGRLMQLTSKIKYKNTLTGTPITQGMWDLYTQMYMLDPRILGYPSYNSFARSHLKFSSKYPDQIDYMINQDYVIDHIKPYVYQVTKKECLDLPPKTYSNRYFHPHSDEEFYEIYQTVKNTMIDKLDVFKPNANIIFMMLTYLQQIASGHFKRNITTREGTILEFDYSSNCRSDLLKEVVSGIDLEQHKAIIFYKYTKDLEYITLGLDTNFVVYNGLLNEKEKEMSLKRFKSKDCPVMVTNIQSGSTGLNLQHANYIIYYNSTFDYAKRIQGEDRIYRIGQEKNCHIIDLIADNTIDLKIEDSIFRKSSLVNWVRNEIKKVQENPDNWEEFKDKLLAF